MSDVTDIPEHVVARHAALRCFANGIRGLFGAPVYLVGSALRADNRAPRDWDIRVCLTDADFTLRYDTGNAPEIAVGQWIAQAASGDWTGIRWRWSDECRTHSKRASQELLLNVDFQVYPETYWRGLSTLYGGLPRVQIDTRDGEWQLETTHE